MSQSFALKTAVTVGVVAGAACLIQLHRNSSRFNELILQKKKESKRPRKVPHVFSWIPFIGAGVEFEKNPSAFIKKYSKSLGTIFGCSMGGQNFVFICDPFELSTVLKHPDLKFAQFLTQTSINALGCHEDDWDESRCDTVTNIFQQKLSGDSLASILQRITFVLADQERLVTVKALLSKMTEESRFETKTSDYINGPTTGCFGREYSVDVFEFVWRLMYDMSTYSMFGKSLPECYEDFRTFCKGFRYLFMGLPNFAVQKYLDARNRLKSRIRSLPVERFSELLKILVNHNVENNNRDSKFFASIGLWFAALGNTAAAAFWCLSRVLDDRDLLEKVNLEIVAMMNGRGIETIGENDLRKCIVLDALIKETLRFYGSTQIYRGAMQDTVISIGNVDYAIKKDTRVVFPSVVLHMNEDIYDDPAAFDYTRFLPDPLTGEPKAFTHKPTGKPLPYAWMPFGAGSTMCPGRFLATQEIMLVIIFFLTKMRSSAMGVPRLPVSVAIFPNFPQPRDPYMMNIRFRSEKREGELVLQL